jgi:protein tyrosine/serine phosphatase
MRNLLALLALALVGCAVTPVLTNGVPNYAVVEPGLVRGGQPQDINAWRWLESIGVTDVVKLNFEAEASDIDAHAVGLVVHYLPIQPAGDADILTDAVRTLEEPDRQSIREAIDLLHARGTRTFYVHCQHGQDRTGLVIGEYRVLHEGWITRAAWREMIDHGYHPALLGLDRAWEDVR